MTIEASEIQKNAANLDETGEYDPDVPGSAPRFANPDDSAEEKVVVYPPAGLATETARALLDAAGEDRVNEVRSTDGGFEVPKDIADAVNLDKIEPDDAEDGVEDDGAAKRPAKKAAAKRPARKATAR